MQIDFFDPAAGAAPLQPGVGEHIFHEMTKPIGLQAKRIQIVAALALIRDHALG